MSASKLDSQGHVQKKRRLEPLDPHLFWHIPGDDDDDGEIQDIEFNIEALSKDLGGRVFTLEDFLHRTDDVDSGFFVRPPTNFGRYLTGTAVDPWLLLRPMKEEGAEDMWAYKNDKTLPPIQEEAISRMYQAIQRVPEAKMAVTFSNEPTGQQCTIAITRPDPASQVPITHRYTSEPVFKRKPEAKARACTVAIESGAFDFIEYGTGAVRVDTPIWAVEQHTAQANEDEKLVRRVERLCRRRNVGCEWYTYPNGHGGPPQYGAALRAASRPPRVYSCPAVYPTPEQAKSACARIAIDLRLESLQTASDDTRTPEPHIHPSRLLRPMTIQEFSASLLPASGAEPRNDLAATSSKNDAGGGDAIMQLNEQVQQARGCGLTTNFYAIEGPAIGAKSRPSAAGPSHASPPPLHGCVLRLSRPVYKGPAFFSSIKSVTTGIMEVDVEEGEIQSEGPGAAANASEPAQEEEETKTFLVPPIFAKRAQAKAAVCLLALSEGLSAYLKDLATEVHARVSGEMRALNQRIADLLGNMERDQIPQPESSCVRDAYGASLSIEQGDSVHSYTVKPRFRSKADAKNMLWCEAVRLGVLEKIPGVGSQRKFLRELKQEAQRIMEAREREQKKEKKEKKRKRESSEEGVGQQKPAKKSKSGAPVSPDAELSTLPSTSTAPQKKKKKKKKDKDAVTLDVALVSTTATPKDHSRVSPQDMDSGSSEVVPVSSTAALRQKQPDPRPSPIPPPLMLPPRAPPPPEATARELESSPMHPPPTPDLRARIPPLLSDSHLGSITLSSFSSVDEGPSRGLSRTGSAHTLPNTSSQMMIVLGDSQDSVASQSQSQSQERRKKYVQMDTGDHDYEEELVEYCKTQNMPPPRFFTNKLQRSPTIETGGDPLCDVGVELGFQQMRLPNPTPTSLLKQGRQRLCRKVLKRLRRENEVKDGMSRRL